MKTVRRAKVLNIESELFVGNGQHLIADIPIMRSLHTIRNPEYSQSNLTSL
jgi:hypothetical protein